MYTKEEQERQSDEDQGIGEVRGHLTENGELGAHLGEPLRPWLCVLIQGSTNIRDGNGLEALLIAQSSPSRREGVGGGLHEPPAPPMPNLRARHMRNHPTEAESLLWQHLRRSQLLRASGGAEEAVVLSPVPEACEAGTQSA